MGKKGKGSKGSKKTADRIKSEKQQQDSHAAGVQTADKISREKRLQMIRTAAYHLAEKRDFQPGAEMDDWLEAERDLKDSTPTDDL
jgi:hypothetical protein